MERPLGFDFLPLIFKDFTNWWSSILTKKFSRTVLGGIYPKYYNANIVVLIFKNVDKRDPAIYHPFRLVYSSQNIWEMLTLSIAKMGL